MYIYSLFHLNILLFVFIFYGSKEIVNFIIFSEFARIMYYNRLFDGYIFLVLCFGEVMLFTSGFMGYLFYSYEPNTF